jgi:hypothetical protein
MTLLGILWYYLMIAPHLLLGVVAFLLISRKSYREFPFFLAYVLAEIVQFFVQFTMMQVPGVPVNAYELTYSIALAISTLLRFGMLYEIARHIMRGHSELHKVGQPVLRWIAAGLVLAGLVLALYTGSSNLDHVMSVVFLLDRAASIVLCGVLLTLFMFSAYLGLSWRSHLFGIALGLGIFASVELANAAIFAHIGHAYRPYIDFSSMATYHICVLIWICYLWAPERVPAKNVQQLPEHDLESWNQELQRFIEQ